MRGQNRFNWALYLASYAISLALLCGCGAVPARAPAAAPVPGPKPAPSPSQQPISITVSPTSVSVPVNASQELSAVVTNDSNNAGVIWSVTGEGCTAAACGTISPASSGSGVKVVYRAPPVTPNPATVSITATSTADSSKSASATVTVTAAGALSIAVMPDSAAVPVNGTQQFTASVLNDSSSQGVTWSVSGAGCTAEACGTISPPSSAADAPVTFAAPAAVPNPPIVTVTATSKSDASKSASVTVTIISASAPSVSIAPTSATVPVRGTQQFTATVSNDASNSGVSWRVGSASRCEFGPGQCGVISPTTSASGVAVTYTAPIIASITPIPITARSVADPSKFATALVTITSTPAITVSITPTGAAVAPNGTVEFTATVQNDSSNKGVSWSVSGSGCAGTGCGIFSSTTSASGATVTYRASVNVPSPASVTVTATSVADPSKSASATVSISASLPMTVSVSPSSVTLTDNQQQQFVAAVVNDPSNSGVTWSLFGTGCPVAGCGTVSPTTSASGAAVTYTAPPNLTAPASVVLMATAIANNLGVVGFGAAINLVPASVISVTISPNGAAVPLSGTQLFTATVNADPTNTGVTWKLAPFCFDNVHVCTGTLGTLVSVTPFSVIYKAPSLLVGRSTGLTATPIADPTKTRTVTIFISP